ncbi:MAG: hypothetical protein QOF48_2307 [Verrucomicrobiota bacterium]|jgi:hypothetical protein
MKMIFGVVWLAMATAAWAGEVMVCPPWEILVVDEAGKPLAGCVVVQEWGSDFKDVYVTGTTNAVTGADGRVSFPARNISPPAGESRWKKIERAIDRKSEGSPASSVFISKPGYQFEWVNSRSEPRNVSTRDGLKGRVVLKAEKRE